MVPRNAGLCQGSQCFSTVHPTAWRAIPIFVLWPPARPIVLECACKTSGLVISIPIAIARLSIAWQLWWICESFAAGRHHLARRLLFFFVGHRYLLKGTFAIQREPRWSGSTDKSEKASLNNLVRPIGNFGMQVQRQAASIVLTTQETFLVCCVKRLRCPNALTTEPKYPSNAHKAITLGSPVLWSSHALGCAGNLDHSLFYVLAPRIKHTHFSFGPRLSRDTTHPPYARDGNHLLV